MLNFARTEAEIVIKRAEYSNIAICDGNDNLMFATNKTGETVYVEYFNRHDIYLYAYNRKKEWAKI